MPAVATVDLFKAYGRIEALKGVSINVEPGQIFGLLGQNGAGKSTLIKILLGIVKLTDGSAELLDQPVGSSRVLNRVGYLPEDHQFPQYHTAHTLLDFYGRLYGMTRSERRARSAEALEIVGLAKRANSKIRTYSKGMKQRLGIAQSFFHDPDVIFLDEPTDGVDPVGRKEIRDLLQWLKEEGRTIFVNSHLLGEVEMISDHVAILHQGRLIREGTVSDLTKQEGSYVIGLAPGQTFPSDKIESLGFKIEKKGQFHEIFVGEKEDQIDQVLAMISEARLNVRHLLRKKQTLEDVFVDVVDSGEPGTDERRTYRMPPAQVVSRRRES